MKLKLFLLLMLFNTISYADDKMEVRVIGVKPYVEIVGVRCDTINSPLKKDCYGLNIETQKSIKYNEVEVLTKTGKTLYLKVDSKYDVKENELVLIDNI